MAIDGNELVNYIRQFIGTDYVWGGQSPGGFDCSGLMVYAFNHFGISLNRTTYDQIGQSGFQSIGIKGLRPGDLVFFDTDGGRSGPDHVAIYAGNGKMIHAPKPGAQVREESMTSGYWVSRFMGGRRAEGVSSVGGSEDDFADDDTQKKLTPEELAANYGWSIAFFNSHPELKKLFDEAVKGSWSANKFQAAIRDTEWFKTTSDTARKLENQKATDPATYKALVEANTIKLKQLAAEIGAAIPPDKFGKLVETVMKTGMDEDQIRYTLGQYITFTKDGTLKGEAGMHAYALKQYASQMGVDLSEDALKNYAARIVTKVATLQDFHDEIANQAKSAFPGWATQIDAGATVQELASPYQQMMAKELELPASGITLNDQLVRQAMNGLNSEGKPVGLTLNEFQSQLRNDPRWRSTDHAQDSAMEVGAQVLRDMGLLGQR